MHKIKIQEHTSIKDIDQHWKPAGSDVVIFDVTKASSFGLFAEGVALGQLRDFELSGLKIGINLLQSPLTKKINVKGKEEDAVDREKLPPILLTLFGLELLHLSTFIEVLGDDLGVNLRSLIGNNVWSEVQRNKGVISPSGKIIYLISRHGYDVPVALRQFPASSDFPSYDLFQKNITPYISELRGQITSDSLQKNITPYIPELRGGGGLSETEKKLTDWLFHCAENSFEHASKHAGKSVQGYRGIILQKVKFELHGGVKNHLGLPDVAKNFISERINAGEMGKEVMVTVITVVDLGVGIHNTVTVPGNETASNLERLQYAFKDGVTSKNTSDFERAGYGLGEAANAARNLRALLFIVSSSEVAYYDFSDEAEKQIPGQELEFIHLEEIRKSSGSSVSIVWAYNTKQADQSTIF